MIPEIDISNQPRYPIMGARYYPPGGIIRHDGWCGALLGDAITILQTGVWTNWVEKRQLVPGSNCRKVNEKQIHIDRYDLGAIEPIPPEPLRTTG